MLRDLHAAGEANAVAQRSRAVVRDLAPMALAGLPEREREGQVLMVLRMASMTGWAP